MRVIRLGKYVSKGCVATIAVGLGILASTALGSGSHGIVEAQRYPTTSNAPTVQVSPLENPVPCLIPQCTAATTPRPTFNQQPSPTATSTAVAKLTNTPVPSSATPALTTAALATMSPKPTPYVVGSYHQQGLPSQPDDCNIYLFRRWSDGSHTWELLQQQACTPVPTIPIETTSEDSQGKSDLDNSQIVSFYGHPNSAVMGIVGEYPFHTYPPEVLIGKLREQAHTYDELNGEKGVIPAIHLIHTIAQRSPGADGMHRARMDEKMVLEYIRVARENDMYVFLDLQIGRASVVDEINAVLPYLRQPNVHIALDPEFAWKPEKEPLNSIGYVTGAEINLVQQMIEEYLAEINMPRRVILIVHQFLGEMIQGVDSIQDYPNVDLVIDMDGFGAPCVKEVKYGLYAKHPIAEYSGMKLFYKYDTELMSEKDVLALDPDIIIYQ